MFTGRRFLEPRGGNDWERRRGGRSRREQHSRTFYVCFPWQTFRGIPRRPAERAARKTNCLLPTAYSPLYIYVCIRTIFSHQKSRGGGETGQLFANPDAWHVRRETRKHSLLFLRRDDTRLLWLFLATSTTISAIFDRIDSSRKYIIV